MPSTRSRTRAPIAIAVLLLVSVSPLGVRAALTPAPSRAPSVVVYGATPGGILAAVTAARAGSVVTVLEPSAHVGGMMSSGLGWTDTGEKAVIGGYTREFFDRMQAHTGSTHGRYNFAPSQAEAVFEAMLSDPRITVRLGERLAERQDAVTMHRQEIRSIRMESGLLVTGRVFIDASYEADLMARAGVGYRLGREATAEYGESQAGVRPARVVVALPPGLDPGIPLAPPGPVGSADDRLQASNYRICVTSNPANQVPFAEPPDYDAAVFEVLLVAIEQRLAANPDATPSAAWFLSIAPLVDQKFDVNDFGPLSIAVTGLNAGYPEASYAERSAIEELHARYARGYLHFLATDERLPDEIRAEMAGYGLCADEFLDNDHWPRLLYLREGRRMVGEYVLKQRDIDRWRSKADTIGMASYRRDSHFVSRWIDGAGNLVAEGTLSPHVGVRWDIPYRSITPRRQEATNLLVPVAASASHVAWSSLRMEPQFMIIGEAAGQAAALAGRQRSVRVQAIDVQLLQDQLRAHGAFLRDRPR